MHRLLHTTYPGIFIPKLYRKDPARRLFNDDYPNALGNKQIMATHNTRTHTRTVIYLLSLSIHISFTLNYVNYLETIAIMSL